MPDTTNLVTRAVDVLDSKDVEYKGGHFIRTPKAVLYTFDLSSNAKILWQILEEHAGSNRKANPGQKRLAALMNVSLSTLKTYLQELKDQGWIITRGSTGDTLDYDLCIPSVFNSLAETYKHSTTSIQVTPKSLKKIHSGLDRTRTDQAPKFAISLNNFLAQGVAGNPARGVAEISARGSQDSGQGVAEDPATNNKNEPEEVTIRIELPYQPPTAAGTNEAYQESSYTYQGNSSGETECGSAAISPNSLSSGQTEERSDGVSLSSLSGISDSSGSAIAADAAQASSGVMHSVPAYRGTPTFDLDSLSDEEVMALSPDFIRTLPGNMMYATGQRKTRVQKKVKEAQRLAAIADNKAFLAEQEEMSNG
ncbi:helix-turn-helix domain-containing protein [Streptomyces sp. NPDC056333]|uniref:helix-turn-helix domain-containing protein n=1 Tax=Streptomyces sp. NPDC056333 TaxID=3345786 RepID=UPI0035D8513E